MVFTMIIITKSVQYWLSRQDVTTKKLPEHQTGKPTFFTKQDVKIDTKDKDPIHPL